MASEVSYTVSDLLKKISSFIDSCDYELAYTFCARALSVEPDNVQVCETTGAVAIELEKYEEAEKYFSKAISMSPTTGHSKYMYMGQLSTGLDAINYFTTGVQLMTTELESLSSSSVLSVPSEQQHNDIDDRFALARKISTALCSMTEIYLTDCCYEPDAEQRCEEYLNQALKVDTTNPEVYQLLASVRLSQQREQDARDAITKSMNLWINEKPEQTIMPPYATRISLVKLLLELCEYSQALTVLDILQKEDDEVIDLWYLYGWCYYCMGQDATEEERTTNWEDARDCLNTCEKLHNKLESDDEDILRHTKELLQTINTVLKPSTSASEDEGEDDNINADDWEEFNSSDDDVDKMEV